MHKTETKTGKRCICFTQSGTQCSRSTSINKHCWQHQPSTKSKSISRSGSVSKRRVHSGSTSGSVSKRRIQHLSWNRDHLHSEEETKEEKEEKKEEDEEEVDEVKRSIRDTCQEKWLKQRTQLGSGAYGTVSVACLLDHRHDKNCGYVVKIQNMKKHAHEYENEVHIYTRLNNIKKEKLAPRMLDHWICKGWGYIVLEKMSLLPPLMKKQDGMEYV